MSALRLLVTGASGFVGRHLLDELKDDCVLYGVARRSQHLSGAPTHPRITWFQTDLGDREALRAVIRRIQGEGGVDAVVHLAAYYDFTGEPNPEYRRTNIEGMRNLLDLCRELRPGRFLFASSVAACDFTTSGRPVTEESPPDGKTPYAASKRAGEEMLGDYRDAFPSWTVRFAALFSDWCEYEPLDQFLGRWLSQAWSRRILAGRGRMAVPYLHLRDAMRFLRRLLLEPPGDPPSRILLASPDRPVSHRELFEAATACALGERSRPILVPKPICRAGLHLMDAASRLHGPKPFVRPWMADCIDRRLEVDGGLSRALLGWQPRRRLEIVRRMPFLVENLKSHPAEWARRNRAARKEVRTHANLVVHRLMEESEQAIRSSWLDYLLDDSRSEMFPVLGRLPRGEAAAGAGWILEPLRVTVRTGEKGIFIAACRMLALRWQERGAGVDEACAALDALARICVLVLAPEAESLGLRRAMDDHIGITLQFGIDAMQEAYEDGLSPAR